MSWDDKISRYLFVSAQKRMAVKNVEGTVNKDIIKEKLTKSQLLVCNLMDWQVLNSRGNGSKSYVMGKKNASLHFVSFQLNSIHLVQFRSIHFNIYFFEPSVKSRYYPRCWNNLCFPKVLCGQAKWNHTVDSFEKVPLPPWVSVSSPVKGWSLPVIHITWHS